MINQRNKKIWEIREIRGNQGEIRGKSGEIRGNQGKSGEIRQNQGKSGEIGEIREIRRIKEEI
jgi:hypothetical protein